MEFIEHESGDSTITRREASIYETLKEYPHRNIAQYFACTGMCMDRYDLTLLQRLKDPRPIDLDTIMDGILKGVRHLHSLGLIHCDINARNILMVGDVPLIANFESCHRVGERIEGLCAHWSNLGFLTASPKTDEYALVRLREFLLGALAVRGEEYEG